MNLVIIVYIKHAFCMCKIVKRLLTVTIYQKVENSLKRSC